MDITQLNAGERATVLSVSCQDTLKDRFAALGILPGAEFVVLKVSLLKKTYLIGTQTSQVAIRKEAAQCVSIKKA